MCFLNGIQCARLVKAVKWHSQWMGNDVGQTVMPSILGTCNKVCNKDQGPGHAFLIVITAMRGAVSLSV